MEESTRKKVEYLNEFRDLLEEYSESYSPELRKKINQKSRIARSYVLEAGCLKLYTISPPPAIGGLLMSNVDFFDSLFETFYSTSPIPKVLDMLDNAIGVMSDPEFDQQLSPQRDIVEQIFESGYVFIAMPMAGNNPAYDDVHDAIQEAAQGCGLNAERIDDVQTNERITDKLLESIKRAQFVVADLTDSRPNVFYEAGYAYGLGKIPIYIARDGTHLEFDIKDYPIIFFSSMRELKTKLKARFQGLTAE
jgi:hypothetical protein